MKSIKAIVFSVAFIAVAVLFLQLAYLFSAVAYNALEKDFIFLKEISWIFRYLLALPTLMAIFFFGGFILADVAEIKSSIKTLLHCFVVGFVTIAGMIYSATAYMTVTTAGVVIFTLSLLSMVAGGFYWLRKQGLMNNR